jgi:hypothetical protein
MTICGEQTRCAHSLWHTHSVLCLATTDSAASCLRRNSITAALSASLPAAADTALAGHAHHHAPRFAKRNKLTRLRLPICILEISSAQIQHLRQMLYYKVLIIE